MTKLRLLGLLLLGALVLAACRNVGDTYRLDDSQRLGADQQLVVVDAQLDSGSVVEGDLNIIASDVMMDGLVQGDLTVVASDLQIGPHAKIEGDLIYCLVRDGELRLSEAATIWGNVRNRCDEDARSIAIDKAEEYELPLRLGSNILLSVVAGFIAALAMLLLPTQTQRIGAAANEYRLLSLALGGFTLIVAVSLFSLWRVSLAVAVPVIFAPLLLIGFLTLVVLIVLGGVSIALRFGWWLMGILPFGEPVPVLAAMLGAASLTFIMMSFRIIEPLSIVTGVLGILFISWALGAALVTRAGTRLYMMK